MRVLVVVNQKGGVGKTTLAVHLAYAAAEAGLRSLLVDLDKQGSLSVSFPPQPTEVASLTASALFSDTPPTLAPAALPNGMAIIRADDTLALVQSNGKGAERRPAERLRDFAADYDLCIIDTPGLIGFNPPMTVAALLAADAVVCPFSVGLYEAKSLSELWDYLKAVKSQAYNPRLRLIGLLPSKVNTKSKHERQALEEIRAALRTAIMPNVLAERTVVKQSILSRRPVWKNTKGASHLSAAREWRDACDRILTELGQVHQ